jgi:hypothetical protein
MRLQIDKEMLIADVQKQFASAYPFLKVEFYKSNDKYKHLNQNPKQIAHDLSLKYARSESIVAGDLVIDDKMTVSNLENAFMDQFGLTAQVFRRSGNIWLETTITDSWTLKQQNDHGREISVEKKRDDKDESDYELNRDQD